MLNTKPSESRVLGDLFKSNNNFDAPFDVSLQGGKHASRLSAELFLIEHPGNAKCPTTPFQSDAMFRLPSRARAIHCERVHPRSWREPTGSLGRPDETSFHQLPLRLEQSAAIGEQPCILLSAPGPTDSFSKRPVIPAVGRRRKTA